MSEAVVAMLSRSEPRRQANSPHANGLGGTVDCNGEIQFAAKAKCRFLGRVAAGRE